MRTLMMIRERQLIMVGVVLLMMLRIVVVELDKSHQRHVRIFAAVFMEVLYQGRKLDKLMQVMRRQQGFRQDE